MKILRTVYITVTVLLCLVSAQGQEVLNASGGVAEGSEGQVDYAIGQMAYLYKTGSNGSITEGVQQPIEISVVTGIGDLLGVSLNLSVYPNPTINYLILSVDDFPLDDIAYKLYNMQGQLISENVILERSTRIDTEELLPAIYVLQVVGKKQALKTFKIIKN